MSMNGTTTTDVKATFLRSQTRLLSAPLRASPTWSQSLTSSRPTNDDDDDDDDDDDNNDGGGEPTPSLPDKTVTDIVSKVNAKIKTHNRSVFSIASQRHVAEQIDALYWNEVVAEDTLRDEETVWVAREADLTETAVLAGLPETLLLAQLDKRRSGAVDEDKNKGQDMEEEEQRSRRRYTELRESAVELARKRDRLRGVLDGYVRLRGLLAPFEDVKADVQPNLVTRDGELARELERMRVLMARVEGRIGDVVGSSLVTGGVGAAVDGISRRPGAASDQEKLARVLELG